METKRQQFSIMCDEYLDRVSDRLHTSKTIWDENWTAYLSGGGWTSEEFYGELEEHKLRLQGGKIDG